MNKSSVCRQIRSRFVMFWNDQSGETSIMSLVLICAILVIGVTVGLASFRDQVVQELGDLSLAIESLDQSFDAGPCGSFADTVPTDDGIGFVP